MSKGKDRWFSAMEQGNLRTKDRKREKKDRRSSWKSEQMMNQWINDSMNE